MSAIDVLQRLWTATLALSMALLVVAALRGVWRGAFGVEHACRLWWLPMLAVIASQLPHAATQAVIVRVPAVLVATAPASTAPVVVGTGVDWRMAIAIAWGVGVALLLLFASWRQARFLRAIRDAQPFVLDAPGGIAEVLRACDSTTGPALVGAWRPRLVLPNDFEQRYGAHERALILAHEAMHARRRDGLIGATATALHALFWFNPLAWWALRRLRRDQELACDAAVLREQPRARRCYANAMLKAQFAGAALPAGSFWPGHPIRERILMLKSATPHSTRRIAGRVAVSALAIAISAAAYAAGQPPPATAAAKSDAHAPEYQLTMRIKRDGSVLGTPTVCMKAGGSASISQVESNDHGAWSLDLNLRAQSAGRDEVRVALDGSLREGDETGRLNVSLSGPVGKPMSVRMDGAPKLELELVPLRGCPARHALPPPPPPPPPGAPPPPPPPHDGAMVMPPLPTMPPPPVMPPRPTMPASPVIPAPPAVPMASATPATAPRPATAPVPVVAPAPQPTSSEQR
ncbi:MAG TPA: M56 family metallopeptidase [Rhodanobacteraceae bacterium]|nr:M56 family metallopeptidase [Rhodanobacteraceae bacterium]